MFSPASITPLKRCSVPEEVQHTPADDTPMREDPDLVDEEVTEEDIPSQPPREKILPVRSYCTRSAGSTCERCVVACPHNAITLDDDHGPLIDETRCTRCGICMGICDAFASIRITLTDLHAKARRIAEAGDPLYFTCNDHIFPGFVPHSNVIVLPCLASVPPEFWTLILNEDVPASIYCDFSYCRDCDTAGPLAEKLFTHTINTAEAWTGKTMGIAEEIPEKDGLLKKYATPREIDRRGIFTSFATEVSDVATGKHRKRTSNAVQDFHEKRERMRAQGHIQSTTGISLESLIPTDPRQPPKRLWPRLKLLEEAAEQQPQRAFLIPHWWASTDTDRCNHHYLCVKSCPAGARSIDEKTGEVDVDVPLCIACGICISCCPEGACDYSEGSAEALIPKEEDHGN